MFRVSNLIASVILLTFSLYATETNARFSSAPTISCIVLANGNPASTLVNFISSTMWLYSSAKTLLETCRVGHTWLSTPYVPTYHITVFRRTLSFPRASYGSYVRAISPHMSTCGAIVLHLILLRLRCIVSIYMVMKCCTYITSQAHTCFLGSLYIYR